MMTKRAQIINWMVAGMGDYYDSQTDDIDIHRLAHDAAVEFGYHLSESEYETLAEEASDAWFETEGE